jgi:mannose-1-phosphate guanylyltransferase
VQDNLKRINSSLDETSMPCDSHTWALVLAAGEGTRLRVLTTTISGATVPKQFCSLHGGPSLFHEALHRAQAVTSRARTCAVVASDHRIWWQSLPRALPTSNLVVQPSNRGTGNGILLPLLHIVARDPEAQVLILPSDHHVREERTLWRSLIDMAQQSRGRPECVLLLGFEPQMADPDLGYIIPSGSDSRDTLPVGQFIEKPPPMRAREIIAQGGLWNAFIVAAKVQTLLDLFKRRMPAIVEQMRAAVAEDLAHDASDATEQLYKRLPTIDFSRDILEGQQAHLRVLPAPHCGWSDLGTIRGVENVLRQSARSADTAQIGTLDWSHLSLAAQYEQQHSKPPRLPREALRAAQPR